MVKRGRPFEPGNHLGRGRPRGSRNKRSLLGEQLLDQHSEALLRKGILMALQGDVPMLRNLIGHSLSRAKDLACKVGPLPMATMEEVDDTSEATLERLASGKITLSTAKQIFDLIEGRRRVIETQELADRLSALELSHKENTPPKSSGATGVSRRKQRRVIQDNENKACSVRVDWGDPPNAEPESKPK